MSEESLEQKLNRLAKSANLKVPNYAIELVPWDSASSTTVLFNKSNQDLFPLEPIISGKIKLYNCKTPKYKVPEDFKGAIGVHRAAIGYMVAGRINNEQSLIEAITPVLTSGLQDLINNFGDLSKYTVSIERPGPEYSVFKEMENAAAFEIRIFVTKE